MTKPTGKPRGRPKGRRTQSNIEKQIAAEFAVLEKIPEEERAIDVLRRMMVLCEGAASKHRPFTDRQLTVKEIKAGLVAPTGDNWARFGQWVDRVVFCAKALAPFQTPTLKAVVVSMPAVNIDKPSEDFGNVRRLNDPIGAARIYRQLVTKRTA